MRGALDNPVLATVCLLIACATGWVLLLFWPVTFIPATILSSLMAVLGYMVGFDEGVDNERKKRWPGE